MPSDHEFYEKGSLNAALIDAYEFGKFDGGYSALVHAFDREEEDNLPD
jgi:hypothetical protein